MIGSWVLRKLSQHRRLWAPAWVLSHARLFVTPWAIAHQAPLSLRFLSGKNRSGLPFPLPGDLPNPGTEPTSPEVPALQTDSSTLIHGGNIGGLALQNESHCKEQE